MGRIKDFLLCLCVWSSAFWVTCLSQSIGKEFITSYLQNFGTQGRFELQITGLFDDTTVTVAVPCNACEKEFEKKITVHKGKVEIVILPPSVEITGSKVFSEVVRISADKEISVVSLSSKPLSTEIALIYPLGRLGTEYRVVVPTGGPSGAFPEFAILSYQGPNQVDIYLKDQVSFDGKVYVAGSKLTVTLQAFQGLQLQGTGNLSGTKIVSQKPVAVLCGHVCTWKYTKCNHVFEQLLPVSGWGKTFMIPPLPWQTKSDILFVSASQDTVIQYQIGAQKQTANLNDGQVLQINVLPKTPVLLSADVSVQAFFYSTGATYQTFTYDTFWMGIPDTSQYSQVYSVIGQANFQNFAFLVVKTSEINGLVVNSQPLPKLEWNQIPGTDFSWSFFQLPLTILPYRVEHPNSPFGLFSVGVASMNSYGTAGASLEGAASCSLVLCQNGFVCKIINNEPHCVPINATCWAWGDPHYHTFDQHKYDFQGTCTYTMAKTCSDNLGLPSFRIFTKNENRGSKRVSYVGIVTVEVYGYTITITRSENGFVKINGLRAHLPVYLNGGALQILQSGASALLVTDFQLQVSYDWNHHLLITINSAYYGAVCGLCGNYNQDPGDDFQTPAGTRAPDATAFGKSWKVDVGDRDACWDDCHGPCVPCQADQAQKYQTEQYCGLITKASDGPFTPCHSKVNPKFHFDGCVYDVCANQGHRQSLCDALASYADACQKEGVEIGEWRKLAGCFLECPPNSEYKLCGTACPATCLNDQTQKQIFCPAVCVEGCQCLQGYVLSQGKCIPKSSCGCVHEGYLYAPNEGFWADDICTKRCVCNPATKRVECTQHACKSTEQCQVVKGVRDCYPIDYSSCTAHGDPHYISFDKYKFDFQGPCAYVLTEVCDKPTDLNWFGVYVQNEYRGNRAVTWTRSVQVNVYGIEIIISRQYPGKILVGGVLTFIPYNSDGRRVKVYRKGPSALIETDFGLTVTFNWDHHVTVTVPGTYRNTLCGLCGNFNNRSADDALVPGGILVPKIPVFGAKGTKAYDPSCREVVDPKCPGVDVLAAQQRASGRDCGLIVAKNGPFRECHGHVDQEAAFQDCIYDYCFLKGRYAFVCAGIANYVSACQAAGITIYAWRSSTFCPAPCPANSHYEVCAKECDQACSSLYFPVPCPTKCGEDCVCNEGFVRSSDACVPVAKCGCLYRGRYYPASEVFYPTCQERCICQAGGNVVCVVAPCGPNEECRLEDGHQKCYPTGNATCSLVGDLYLSFDGLPVDFQGTCSYILTTLHAKNVSLQPFTVVVHNEAWGNGNIAVPKVVSVEIFEFALSLLQNKWGYVQINGVFHRLPVNLLDGQLRIDQHGFYQRIDASFGFTLTYDLFYHVRVTVPSTYQGQLGGLCGNYNRQQKDDLQLPDGTVVSDVAVFAAAWKIQTPGIPCTDGCSGNSCPVCKEEKKELFKQRTFCGILTATDGPFSSCHVVVDPTPYLNHCILDLCVGGGDRQVLCRSIQSYVAACQEAKVNIQPWRSPDFCPPTCPANSHYAICSNICEVTCAGLTDHLKCPETCVEGCQCDDGFFSDGIKCISLDECGCFENNMYFPPNEPVLQNNCSQKCICSPAGGFFCEDHACLASEACVVKNGIMQCQDKGAASCSLVLCQNGFVCKIINNEPRCVPINATCWAWGDPHYHTFDQHKYDFQGTCTYTMAKTCSDNLGLPSFRIFTKNENRGSKRVSYVGIVTVEVYGYTITITRSENGFVKINGLRAHLPVYLNGGALQILQSGASALLVTDFQLQVSYDWNHHLLITINSAYYGAVCGLCGNYNQDPGDDFQTPAGTRAPDATAFGKSWKVDVGDRDACWDDCHGPCVPCQADQAQKYQTEQYCGLITKASDGPFTPCHSKVNPKFHFDGCVYDVCANQGHRQSLCDALASYADACQKEGVEIGEWRKLAGCFLECPPNSEYKLCGTACPATCLDDQTQKQIFCPAVCVEGCQCLQGYVLSQGKCIPKSSCGCVHEGYLYAPNEGFWADDICTKRCVCNPATKRVECTQHACKSTEQCQVVKGVRDCYPIDYSSCTAHGDPHYISFDKYKFDFQGPCAYVLTEVCDKPTDLNWFGVYVQNEYRGNRAVTWTRSVQVNVYGIEIIISRQYPGKILVGGVLTFIPYNSDGRRVKVYRKGPSALIETDFDLTVTFNWDHHVTVTVPGTYRNTLCGLCGNFNNRSADDALVPGGILVPKIPVFGAKGTKAYDPSCREVVDPKCPGVDVLAAQQRASGRDCGLIVAKNGPFRECHGHVDQEAAFQDCIYDYCFLKGRYAFVCAGIANYVSACQAAGITIYAWRSSTFCPAPCPANSHYEVCAKECDQACSSLYFPVPCPTKCGEDCVCNEGFVRSSDACVPVAKCGCLYRGRYYPASEVFYPTCQERCICQAGGNVVCVVAPCGPNEECRLEDGHQKCYPTGNATCSLVGDLYLSFDGLPVDFQGTCSYILTTLHAKNVSLQPFTVVVHNEAWGNGNIAVPKVVSVEIFEFALSLLQNKWGYVQINGVFHRLPVNLLDGQLRIDQHGFYQRIDASFGFTLTYDLFYHVRVTVPSTYQGQLGGLCGNYNRQQKDDLQLPDGTVVSDVAVFAAAWKIQTPGIPCTDGCSGNSCPVCKEEKKELFKQRTFCGILTATDGPFSSCHVVVDPTPYLNHCILDLCVGGGDRQVLCRSIQSYVAACQEAKVNIQPWRSPDFCPPTCPANSHYAICSNICEVTCAGLTDHLKCPETCVEGCQCDDGFFSDGIKCISLDECGCFENNMYFPPNEPVLQNNCSQKCICSPAGGFFCEDHACLASEACVVKNGIMQCQDKGAASCSLVLCQNGFVCKIINNEPRCVPINATCWAWGDPHYHTFDQHKYDFQGTCTYTMAKTCSDNLGLPSFRIFTKNENRGSKRVSYVGIVTVEVYGYTITITRSENGFVKINGLRAHLPVYLNGGALQILQSGASALLVTDFQLQVSYDWNHHLLITINSAYYGAVCGLCGNYNQDPGDDFQTPAGTRAPDATAFGKSWKVDVGDRDACWDDCHGPCVPCQADQAQKYQTEQYCGLITKASDGPFTPCHSKVNPKFHFDGCVYDVCANQGHRQSLCDALASYADACQKEGVEIGEWRKLAGCFLECPPNSEYKLCGTACPATCLNDQTQKQIFCPAVCVEGCQCLQGYVLSQGKCIPKSSCGCVHEGYLYAPNEGFWADDICTKRCVCNPATKRVECTQHACKSTEQCQVVKGVRDCYPIDYSSCTAHGDPHYISFDKYKFDFQGPCAYVLTEVCDKPTDLNWFGVYVQNEYRGNRAVTWTRSVQVNVYGIEIIISRQYPGKILVGGVLTFIPYNSDGRRVKVYRKGPSALIETDFGLTVTFNWDHHVTVTVPGTYRNTLCGLCGNFNNRSADDALVPGGILVPKIPVFGAKGTKAYDPSCREVVDPKCPGVDVLAAQQRASGRDCGLIVAKNGPFRECHGHVDQEAAFQDCIYDYCFLKGRYAFVCAGIANYVSACQAAGITIYAWRSSTFCPAPCPANSHYEVCAKECDQACSSLYFPVPCPTKGGEDCVCNEGFVRSSDACVPVAKCGCLYRGRYYPASEVFYPTCQERCICQAGGNVVCVVTPCGPNEECRLEDGHQKCYPTGNATCSLVGDLYLSFDGLPVDFQGTCSYILTTLHAKNVSLQPFTVVVHNEAWGNGNIAVPKVVSVEIFEFALSLLQNKWGYVQINGVFHRLPVNLLDGQLRIDQHGFYQRIDASFGFTLTYDLFYHVRVTVPSTYQGQLGGLCGNYNRQQKDDLQLPDGTVVSDVAVFAAAWKIQTPGIPCTDGCSGNSCPVCKEEKKELFKQRTFCGILTATDGPFSSCHVVVDPTPYLNHCILDLCVGGGDRQVLCRSIQSYVAACQEAKVNIQPWRSPDFCPPTCPANSHYAICSNICEVTCAGLTDHLKCPETCVEGCQCDDGFFSDGIKCISLDECGCFENNMYFPPNEPVLQNNCSQKCICSPAGGFFCEDHACLASEACVVKNGIMQCQDKDPCKVKTCRPKETCQIKDGQAVCVPDYIGNCWCWGDPHCGTFDGYKYDFQGTCSYVLSKSTGSDKSLVPFSVVTKNENRGGNTAVSYVRDVLIHAYELEITIRSGENGRIRVNGVIFNLPVSLLGGQVRIFSSGNLANVQTDFGLLVTFDWNWRVEVHLPSSYYGNTGGLCGNFNQLPEDDRRGPDGLLFPSVISWATAWAVEDGDPHCFHECSGTCPICDQQKLAKYKTDGQCGIISISTGPFQGCHAVLDPKVFLDNCALDVCMNGGGHDILCQAVNSYAQACHQQGRQVGDWRTPINCPLPCPENSHYVACGSRCPATCSSRNAPLFCSKECVETCQCNDGYILSTNKCVPIESCGCLYNGFYYEPEEQFWDQDCGLRCRCDSKLGAVVCTPASCQTGEQCRVVNGVRGCYPSSSTCISAGDYHYTTFDGQRYKFEGSCIYQLAKVCLPNPALTPFDISAQNSPAPVGRAVTLRVYGINITLHAHQGDQVKVNGNTKNLPFSHEEKIHVSSDETHFAIKTDFGLLIKLFKGNLSIETTVPWNFAGHLCGLCGNANGDPSDDKIEDGKNWWVGCSPGCSPDCSSCTPAELESYQKDQYCGLLRRADGPFISCYSAIPVASFFDECIKKTCAVRGQTPVWCEVIASYVAACQVKNVALQNWRTDNFCPQPCPANSHYELCGTRCAATCENPQLPLVCKAPCGEGCICDPGFILSGNHCVPLRECVCEFEGVYYKKGEEFFSNTSCQKCCRCMEDGMIQCHDFCTDEDSCKVVNDVPVCFPRESGTCYALDGWNYVTFDDVHYSLPAFCSYILAQSDERHKFSVAISAGSNGIEKVKVQASGYHVVFQRGKNWETLVNGERLLLPANLGNVSVRQEGIVVLLRTNFGLRVYYDLSDWVAVSLPGAFQGLLKGLCGNFNKDKNDEFFLPNGKPVQDLTEFGTFWKVEGGSCLEGCKDKCHVCDESMEAVLQAKNYCRLIQAVPGPFSGCHNTVNPNHFFNYCVASLCATNGAIESLCQSLQAYATACQVAGATIEAWRTYTTCPALNCLPGTHYELCARNCKGTCARDLSCVDPCIEGCVCNAGTWANGAACVKAEQCGCWYDGRLFQQGESYLSSDCRMRCRCEGAGQLSCLLHSCGTGEVCGLRNGLRGCFPTEGRCIMTPGDHFSSFDGLSGNISAPGAYQLVSLCNIHSDDWFRLIVRVTSCLPVQTITATLHIFFKNLFITVNDQKEVWVNGLPVEIPLQITNSVKFDLTGDVIVLQTPQVQITFGPNRKVAVSVIPALSGKVCGACGNFNQTPVDDLKGPGGVDVSNVPELLSSWTARDFAALCALG